MSRPRRMLNLEVSHVSLCRRGANRMRVVLKNDDSFEVSSVVVKFDEPEGLLYTLTMVPDHEDAQGEVAGGDIVRKAMYGWMRRGGQIDRDHSFETLDRRDVYPVEVGIVQKGDDRWPTTDLEGKPVDPVGAWGTVIKLESSELLEEAKLGLIGGTSIGGVAVYDRERDPAFAGTVPNISSEAIDRLAAAVTKTLNRSAPEGDDTVEIDYEKLAEATAKHMQPMVDAAVKAATPQPATEPEPATKADEPAKLPTAEEALKAARDLEQRELAAKFDLTTAKGNREYAEALAKLDATDEPEPATKSDGPEPPRAHRGPLPSQLSHVFGERVAKELQDRPRNARSFANPDSRDLYAAGRAAILSRKN